MLPDPAIPPEPPVSSTEVSPQAMQESKTSFARQSKVQTLLGISMGISTNGTSPLLSANRLPNLDLPYVHSQTQRSITPDAPTTWNDESWNELTEFTEDSFEDIDEVNFEPSLSAFKPQRLPPDQSQISPVQQARQQTNSAEPMEVSETLGASIERIQKWVEAVPTEADFSSNADITPEITSVHIPGITSANVAQPVVHHATLKNDVDEESIAPMPLPDRQTPSTSSLVPSVSSYNLATDAHVDRLSPSSEFVKLEKSAVPLNQSQSSLHPSQESKEIVGVENSVDRVEHHQPLQFSHLQSQKVPLGLNSSTTQSDSIVRQDIPDRSLNYTTAPLGSEISWGVEKSAFEGMPPRRVEVAPVSHLRPILIEREVTRNQSSAVQNMAEQVEKLKQAIADLSSQIAAQKDFDSSKSLPFSQLDQPQSKISRPAAQPSPVHAFWERSYTSRLYRW